MAWLLSWLWVPGVMLLLCFLPLYFPNGRLVSQRWKWVVRLALFVCVTGGAYRVVQERYRTRASSTRLASRRYEQSPT